VVVDIKLYRLCLQSISDVLRPDIPSQTRPIATSNGLVPVSSPRTPQSRNLSSSVPPKRSFAAFSYNSQHGPSPVVNVTPTPSILPQEGPGMAPEIRKYKKKFHTEILCASLWGVNLLVGTENGLMLLDRSGHGKGYINCSLSSLYSVFFVMCVMSEG
jgi:hypothetical protein